MNVEKLSLLLAVGWACAAATAAPAAGQAGAPAGAEIVQAVLDGSDGHRERLRLYLAERDNAPPDLIAARAVRLIGALERESRWQGAGFDTLKTAIDRVVRATGTLLDATRVLSLGVEAGYRPDAPVLALDLGPPGPAADGFARVDARDRRVGGRHLMERGRPGMLLESGIRGVRRLVLPLPDGAYRVILLAPAADRGGPAPFGREIRVGRMTYAVARPVGGRWADAALLAAPGAAVRPDGRLALAADLFAFVHRARNAADTGGAAVVEGRAAGGRLVVEFEPAGSLPVVVSGVLVERLSSRSDLLLGGEASRYAASLRARIGLEERLVADARRVLERAAAAAGRRSLFALPGPALARREGGP